MRSTAIPPPAGPLTDGVVCLRYRRAADLDAICAASHDPEALRWLSDPPMDDEARAVSLARVAEAFRTGRSAPLVIADRATDQPAGLINVQFRDDQLATIAYSVFPGRRGQGVAPRAVRPAAGWAFSQHGSGHGQQWPRTAVPDEDHGLAGRAIGDELSLARVIRRPRRDSAGQVRSGYRVFDLGGDGFCGCFNRRMTAQQEASRVVSVSRDIAAAPEKLFELV